MITWYILNFSRSGEKLNFTDKLSFCFFQLKMNTWSIILRNAICFVLMSLTPKKSIVLFLPKRSNYTNAFYVHFQVLKILIVIIPELLMNTQGQQRHVWTGKSYIIKWHLCPVYCNLIRLWLWLLSIAQFLKQYFFTCCTNMIRTWNIFFSPGHWTSMRM